MLSKDMTIVMKQQNRAEEAIEAIKSLRNRCSDQAQESLDNILLDLYKRCGRLDDQTALLKHKLQLIQQGLTFNGKRTKTARSQGRKFQVSVEQEATRLLGNLGWALMQKENYVEAEGAYRKALRMGPDNNKMCNLGICLMKQGRIAEAKDTLKQVRAAVVDSLRGADSHLKAYERAQEMLHDLEAKLSGHTAKDRFDRSRLFDAFIESSSIWQPQPCIDYLFPARERFADENISMNRMSNAKLEFSSKAPPLFYSSRMMKDLNGNLKRTRPGKVMEKSLPPRIPVEKTSEQGGNRRKSEDGWPELPDNNELNDAIVAAVLAPVLEDDGIDASKTDCNNTSPALNEGKMGKRLRIFQELL